MTDIDANIKAYYSKGRDKELARCTTRISATEQQAAEAEEERDALSKNITTIRKDLDTQQVSHVSNEVSRRGKRS